MMKMIMNRAHNIIVTCKYIFVTFELEEWEGGVHFLMQIHMWQRAGF